MNQIRLLILIVCLFSVRGTAQNYMFKRLDVKNGLPNNQISSVFKDSEGFMWFGTVSGLARYDGYSFRIFQSGKENTSLPDNLIEQLMEDGEGRIWMRAGESYTFFDLRTETFERNIRSYLWGLGIDGEPLNVYIDEHKDTWFFVGGKGCYRHRAGEKTVDALLFSEDGLPDGHITDMVGRADELWIVYNNGLLVGVDTGTMKVKQVLDDIPEEISDRGSELFSLFADDDGDLWIYSVWGVWVYNPADKQWKSMWNVKQYSSSHNIVRAVEQDCQGRIWLGKDQGGVTVLDKKTGKAVSLVNHTDDDRSVPNNTITVLYEDHSGTMWVGTYQKGVAYYNESLYKFSLDPLGNVNAIEEDGNGCLWLGTNDAGLVHWNPVTKEKKMYLHKENDPNSITANVIVSLLRARDGKLWIGSFWGGLDCFDGHRFVHYRNRPDDPNSLANNNVWSLAEDEKGNIWIGTLGGGLQCLDPQTGKFTNYNVSTCGIVSNYISSLYMGQDGCLIVGTASSGIAIVDLNTRKVTNMVGTKSGDVRLSKQSVNQVYMDSRGLIWIATRDGLNLYDPKNDRLQVVPFPQRKAAYFISSIVEDDNRNMWVTTSNGVVNILLSMDERTREFSYRFYMYDDKDGLQGSEFNQRSIKRLASGQIAMGGLYGVNLFYPAEIKYNRILPKVMFTGFQLFNEDVEVGKEYGGRLLLDKSLNAVSQVKLDYRQNVFTVLFASDNFVLPDKTTYYYKLEGFDNNWMVSPPEMHRATYTNLTPGTYTLKVKAVNSDGFEGREEASLQITILPPFWMTPWAYAVYVLLALGIVFAFFYAVQRRERNKFKIRQMEEDAKKKEELNQMKFRFFTNVSHELRTPLTLIISPLESMMKEMTEGKQLERLKLMHRNALRLLNLVNQLLDFRKNEMVGLHLSLSEGDIVLYIRNICSSFLMLSEKKGGRLTFYSAVDSLNMSFDEDKIGKVVMNLLSNAFKFTPEGGRVDVALGVLKNVPDRLQIKVSDTGIGIKDEDKERIFERFYQVEQPETEQQSTGSGIGLSLVRDFVTLHEGTVRVVDNVGSGSVFLIEIPIKHVVKAVSEPRTDEEDMEENELLMSDVDNEPEMEEGDNASEDIDDETAGRGKEKPLALIVDDNEDLIVFMKDSLSLYFRIRSAANGREAWQMIPELMPDIIVSDVMMPEMDGNELCRWVKTDKRTENIPLILLTAKQAVEDKVEGLTIGADDYVTKPFNVEVLILRMRKLIDLSGKNKLRTLIDPEPSEIVITSLDEKLIENAIKYVEANISRSDLSVEELGHELGMSRVHLYKKLLQITGKSPIEFIRIIRLKRAAQLLRESQQNVSEIAYQLGFNNPKYFSKYFKDEFGVLPSVYQEREGK